jgi:hypothetical protein
MGVQDLYFDRGTGKVFVELFNQLHWVVDPATLNGVFGPNPRITDDKPPYPIGFDINAGSCLVTSAGKVYLYADRKKFWITSPAALEHYQFNGPRFPAAPQDVVLADNLVQLAEEGDNINA